MGNSQTYGLTEAMLEDYEQLTYLSKNEIMYLMKKFYSIDPAAMDANFHHRMHMDQVKAKFPVLKHNPFQDRLFLVFSSKKDNCFSFEDLLDMCSVMSADCPTQVKAAWAFRVFDVMRQDGCQARALCCAIDIDDDNQIGEKDISNILDRLVWDFDDPNKMIDNQSKHKIANILLKEMDLHNIGSMSQVEFRHAMTKIPEFDSSFYFRL